MQRQPDGATMRKILGVLIGALVVVSPVLQIEAFHQHEARTER